MFVSKLFSAVALLTSAIGTHGYSKCYNSAEYSVVYVGKEYTCSSLRMPNNSGPRWNLCHTEEAQEACPHTCGLCCSDSVEFEFPKVDTVAQMRKCDWLTTAERVAAYCNGYSYDGFTIRSQCQTACSFCFDSPTPTIAPVAPTTPEPTTAPTAAPTSAPTTAAPTTAPTAAPTSAPTTASPTAAPTTAAPTTAPTAAPTAAPVSCSDGVGGFSHDEGGSQVCTWFGTNLTLQQSRLDSYCGRADVIGLCSETCGYCTCADDATYEWDLIISPNKGSCAWLTKNSLREAVRKARYCTDSFMDGVVKYRC